jgi:hypothetical protein
MGLLNLAEELGNVSKACKVMGFSRDTFYRYRELVDEGGIENLVDKTRVCFPEKIKIKDWTYSSTAATSQGSHKPESDSPEVRRDNRSC